MKKKWTEKIGIACRVKKGGKIQIIKADMTRTIVWPKQKAEIIHRAGILYGIKGNHALIATLDNSIVKTKKNNIVFL